jgi:ankyrin repeat protein
MSLIPSVWNNDLADLKTLIARGADVNAVTVHGYTALWYAAERGQVECATALIHAKADVNKANKYGETPLHAASNDIGGIKSVLFLIKHKADVNALTIFGSSSLHFASIHGYLACVQTLVTAGAEIDRPNNGGYTPFAYAIGEKHFDVAESLLHSGAKMKNVKPTVYVPPQITEIITKRRNVMVSTLALKGLLKRRLGISKDVTNLIALYFWNTRLK